jgi:predicted nuclease with TOPRIM domain
MSRDTDYKDQIIELIREREKLKALVEQYQGMDRVASATIKQLELENEQLNKEIDQLRGQILRNIKEKAEAESVPKCKHGFSEPHWYEAEDPEGSTRDYPVGCPGPKKEGGM